MKLFYWGYNTHKWRPMTNDLNANPYFIISHIQSKQCAFLLAQNSFHPSQAAWPWTSFRVFFLGVVKCHKSSEWTSIFFGFIVADKVLLTCQVSVLVLSVLFNWLLLKVEKEGGGVVWRRIFIFGIRYSWAYIPNHLQHKEYASKHTAKHNIRNGIKLVWHKNRSLSGERNARQVHS